VIFYIKNLNLLKEKGTSIMTIRNLWIIVFFSTVFLLTAEGVTSLTLLNAPVIPLTGKESGSAFLLDSGYIYRQIDSMDTAFHAISISPVFSSWEDETGYSCSLPVNYIFADTEDYGFIEGYSFSQQFNVNTKLAGSSGQHSLYLSAGVMNTFTSLHYDVHMINNSKTVQLNSDNISFNLGMNGRWYLSEKISINPFYSFRALLSWPAGSEYIYSASNFQEISQENEYSHLIGMNIEFILFQLEVLCELRHNDGSSLCINTRIPLSSR